MQVPLSRFSGLLKQIDREGLGPAAEAILNSAFPGFWPAPSVAARARGTAARRLGVDFIRHDLDPPRRLSGCWTLPRGRYYTLCDEESGHDTYTLLYELAAYLDPMRGGLLVCGDMGIPQSLQFFRDDLGFEEAQQGDYILVAAIGRPGAISPVLDALGRTGLIENITEQQRKGEVKSAIKIPYRITKHQIDSVFDLRTLEAQEYVVEAFFKSNSSKLTKPDRSGIDRFVDALPILMYPERGGGPSTEGAGAILQAAAAFLRYQGVQALIYPSARSDVFAQSKGRQLTAWGGWCLVDYRGAREALLSLYVDHSPGWPKTFPKGAMVQVALDGEYAGSFEISGIVKWNRERTTEAEARFLQNQKTGSW